MQQLSLSLLEIIVLMAGAITLGITIHFFIVSRRSLKSFSQTPDRTARNLEEWKLRYFNDLEKKDKEIAQLRSEAGDKEYQYNKLEEEIGELKTRLQRSDSTTSMGSHAGLTVSKWDYLEQLQQARRGLLEQNVQIAELLGKIEAVHENETVTDELRLRNEELVLEVDELKERLKAREKEIEEVRQRSQLSREMSSMLDNAYHEFNILQEKILKLETQVSSSKRISMEYEDLREGFFKASRDLEEQRSRLSEVLNENRELQQEIADAEDKLREANFQRQQLQKRVAYLEELNQDLQAVTDANRKLENQLKRIGELESLLNVMAEERDQARKQMVHHSDKL